MAGGRLHRWPTVARKAWYAVMCANGAAPCSVSMMCTKLTLSSSWNAV